VLVSPSIDTLPDQVMVGDADVLGLEIPIPLSAVTEATVHINMAGEPGGPLPAVMLRFNPVPRERSPETRSVEMLVPVRETSKSVPIPLGQYDITVLSQTTGTLPLGFFVKSIVAGSTDLMKQPLTVSTKSEPEIRVTIGAPSPPPWVKVSGRVTKLEGAKVKPTTITLSSTPPVSPDLTTTIHPDGGFEFPMVLPGNYSVRLAPQPDPILRNIVIDSAGKANIEIPLFVPLP
jgi:hypothetical protein